MILAASKGHKDIVEYLVIQGADKDIKNNVSTPLVHLHLYNMIHICMYLSTRECMYIYVFASVCEYLLPRAFFCVFIFLHICISVFMSVYEIIVFCLIDTRTQKYNHTYAYALIYECSDACSNLNAMSLVWFGNLTNGFCCFSL